jgi:dolichol-phosphate mannosyltransferase
MFAGLHYARGRAVITMDSDLQHPPATIPQLYSAWLEGYQIVETVRSESEDATWFKRTTSRWFYKVFSALSGIPMSSGTSDFRLMDARVVEVVREMKDADLFLRGIAHWVGFRRKAVPFQAINRHAGESKYNLARMIKFAVSSLISFSTIPLRLGIWIGLATSLLAFLELIYILIAYIRGNVVPGWASTLAFVSFLFGILFLLVGIIGAYLASIFETLKNRPRFLVSDTEGFPDE